MKKEHPWKGKYLALVVGLLFAVTSLVPTTLWANDDVKVLKEQLQQLTDMMQTLQQKLETLEAKNSEKEKIGRCKECQPRRGKQKD